MASSLATPRSSGNLSDPPGERGNLFLGVAPDFWRDPPVI